MRRSSSVIGTCWPWSFPGCVADGGEQSADVVVVDSGDGVAEVDGDAACELAAGPGCVVRRRSMDINMNGAPNKLSKGEHLKTLDGTLAVADGGTAPKVHEGWMWDLTVPGNTTTASMS